MFKFRVVIADEESWDYLMEWCESTLKSIPMWRYIPPWHHTEQNLYDLYFWDEEDMAWFCLSHTFETAYSIGPYRK